MCRPKPYSRCTRHSLDQLLSAEKSLAEISADYDRLKHGRNSKEKEQLYGELERGQAKVFQARKEYNSSPGGIKELEGKVAGAKNPQERLAFEGELELARYARGLHNMAGKNYDRFKENIESADLEKLLAMKNLEQELNRELANQKNSATGRNKEALASRVNGVKNRRLALEEALRQKAAGVDPLNSRKKELSELEEGEESWVQIPAQSLGELRKYLPFGAYAKVTGVKKSNSNPNYLVSLESSIEKLVSPRQVVLVQKKH